jgi:hypothetical protein
LPAFVFEVGFAEAAPGEAAVDVTIAVSAPPVKSAAPSAITTRIFLTAA